MNIKIFMSIVSIFLSVDVWADTKNEVADTIPFVIYKTRVIYYSVPAAVSNSLPQAAVDYAHPSFQGSNKTNMQSSVSASAVEQEASTSNIPTADVQSLIRRVRNAVCNSVGDGDVRVWVSIDASGKLLGVGASTQSGLEVTFHCKTSRH